MGCLGQMQFLLLIANADGKAHIGAVSALNI
jgi:hypothetical protein